MAGNTPTDAASEASQQPSSANGEAPVSAAGGTSSQQQAPEVDADERAASAKDPERERLVAELDTLRKKYDTAVRAVQAGEKDREEFKQRLTRERERMLDVERGNVAVTLLEAIDELDRCLSASANDTSPLAEGVRMIREVLLTKVQGTGIERLQVVGQTFDPNVAEAADMEITTTPDEDQRIVAELRAGYRLKDRVIRPARVKVAKYIAPAQA
ncbi:nucleotide exchange factor GrpE [Comamonas sp. JC664]|uniref:nucleotide exchange factor GrpE n=1 Tax=Comamonas sp. JC664 TaxID=2801917 RepID=UPI00174A984B|nr:nucleotide exchange factor GrpE [Comamonas sp. JC664]MBL0696374.1 nucleotide exchange factor GrpE [Comamonas sp. JC664]GHG83955.1 protein GrpE [Comamonas sp. KCTC 72670]